jgi:hypothetical protein
MPTATGKIVGESIAAYHAADSVSNSKLKVFASSPLLYFKTYVRPAIKREDDEAQCLSLGSALGAMVEGGVDCFDRSFAVNREFPNFKTQAAKDWKAAAEGEGKTVLSLDELATVSAMYRSLCANPDAAAVILDGEPEVTFRLQLDAFSVQARPDRWHEKPVTLSDGITRPVLIGELKTTASLSPSDFTNFLRQYNDLGYYRQAALYREVVATVMGLDVLPELLYVVVENCEPYRCRVFAPDAVSLNLARAEILDQLRELRHCYQSGDWSSGDAGIFPLSLPAYAVRTKLAALEAKTNLPALPEYAGVLGGSLGVAAGGAGS